MKSCECDVLLLDGDTKAALAVVRSLGKAGLRVIVGSEKNPCIASASRFSSGSVITPCLSSSPKQYAEFLLEAVDLYKPRMILPVTNQSLEIVLDLREHIERTCVVPFASTQSVRLANDKLSMARVCKDLGIPYPRTLPFLLGPRKDLHTLAVKELKSFPFPAVLKPQQSDTLIGGSFFKEVTRYIDGIEQLEQMLSQRIEVSPPLILQEHVHGQGVGISALCYRGETLLLFAHRRLLEKPPSGGISVLCESLPMTPKMEQLAKSLISDLEWSGVCMIECKLDQGGDITVIEINPRFWGSLQLAIDAGRDFPLELHNLYRSRLAEKALVIDEIKKQNSTPYKQRRLRSFLGTIDHLWHRLKDLKTRDAFEILLFNKLQLFARLLTTRFQVFRLRDPWPAIVELTSYLRDLAHKPKDGSMLEAKDPTSPCTSPKIAIFIESGGFGGAETVVLSLAEYLQETGCDIQVITLRTGWLSESLVAKGIPWIQISSTRHLDLYLIYQLYAVLRKTKRDVLHSHLLDSNFYGAIAARLAGVSHIATDHGDVHHFNPRSFVKLKVKAISTLGSHWCAVSRYTQEKLEALGAPANRIGVIGNPIRANTTQNPDLRAQRRNDLGLDSKEDWLWIHVARLDPVKDQKLMLEGFAKARSLSRTKQFLLILGDGSERTKLETIAKNLGLAEHVLFLGFCSDVAQWLNAADGFLLTSHSEALPMSLIEAGSYALASIGIDVGGVSEILGQGKDRGILVASRSSDDLAQQISWMVENKSSAQQMGSALQEFVRREFAPLSVVQRYVELYRSLCNHSRPR